MWRTWACSAELVRDDGGREEGVSRLEGGRRGQRRGAGGGETGMEGKRSGMGGLVGIRTFQRPEPEEGIVAGRSAGCGAECEGGM